MLFEFPSFAEPKPMTDVALQAPRGCTSPASSVHVAVLSLFAGLPLASLLLVLHPTLFTRALCLFFSLGFLPPLNVSLTKCSDNVVTGQRFARGIAHLDCAIFYDIPIRVQLIKRLLEKSAELLKILSNSRNVTWLYHWLNILRQTDTLFAAWINCWRREVVVTNLIRVADVEASSKSLLAWSPRPFSLHWRPCDKPDTTCHKLLRCRSLCPCFALSFFD